MPQDLEKCVFLQSSQVPVRSGQGMELLHDTRSSLHNGLRHTGQTYNYFILFYLQQFFFSVTSVVLGHTRTNRTFSLLAGQDAEEVLATTWLPVFTVFQNSASLPCNTPGCSATLELWKGLEGSAVCPMKFNALLEASFHIHVHNQFSACPSMAKAANRDHWTDAWHPSNPGLPPVLRVLPCVLPGTQGAKPCATH